MLLPTLEQYQEGALGTVCGIRRREMFSLHPGTLRSRGALLSKSPYAMNATLCARMGTFLGGFSLVYLAVESLSWYVRRRGVRRHEQVRQLFQIPDLNPQYVALAQMQSPRRLLCKVAPIV